MVVIYRPFYEWVVSVHNQHFFAAETEQPLTEWLTLDMMHGFVSDTEDLLFCVSEKHIPCQRVRSDSSFIELVVVVRLCLQCRRRQSHVSALA